MQRNLIRVLAVIVLISPWLYIGETLRDSMSIIVGIIILLATVDTSKNKKDGSVI